MKLIAFLSLPLLASAAYAQDSPLNSGSLIFQRGARNQPYVLPNKTRNTEILRDEPIFENLPFLKLRAGDQLVRTEVDTAYDYGGSRPDGRYNWSKPYPKLKRADGLVSFHYREKEGRLLEPEPASLPLFTWELTRANADALFQFLRPTSHLSVAQLARLDIALQVDLPEYLGDGLTPILNQPEKATPGFLRTITEDGKTKFVYAGFTYDDMTGNIYLYHLILGADEWQEKRKILISAPPEPKYPSQQVEGGAAFRGRTFLPLKETLPQHRRYEAQVANRRKFFQVVREALETKAP